MLGRIIKTKFDLSDVKTLAIIVVLSLFLLGCVENNEFEEYKSLAQKSTNSEFKVTYLTDSGKDLASAESRTAYHKKMKNRVDITREGQTIFYYGYEDLDKKISISCTGSNNCKKRDLTKEDIELRSDMDKLLQIYSEQNLKLIASKAGTRQILGITTECFRVAITQKGDVIQQIFPQSNISCLEPTTGVELYSEEMNSTATSFSTTVSDDDLLEPKTSE